MQDVRNNRVFQRDTILAMLHAALETGETRFARQVALSWLAAFPGDLEVSLLQARGMIMDGKGAQVIPALETVCQKDPFNVEVYRLLAAACKDADPLRYAQVITCIYVLDGTVATGGRLAAWGEPLRSALMAYQAGNYPGADTYVHTAMRMDPEAQMPAVMHLQVCRAMQDSQAVQQLAAIYHTRWPECLQITMILAEACLEAGDEPEAVRLLHLCVANDSTGQATRRLWGENHPYRALWPDEMVILFDRPVPAAVAGRLGWNQLRSGMEPVHLPLASVINTPLPQDESASIDATSPEEGAEQPVATVQASVSSAEDCVETDGAVPSTAEVDPSQIVDELVQTAQAAEAQARAEAAARAMEAVLAAQAEQAAAEAEALAKAEALEKAEAVARADKDAQAQAARNKRETKKTNELLLSVEHEFERLAKKLKKTQIIKADARYPVYVLFSTREGMVQKYGPQTADILDSELRKLATAIRRRPGWDALVYYPDDPGCTGYYGLSPVEGQDPWKLKHSLADLDTALRKKGEMIGALLIVGGEQVVPFHRLPNPADDGDSDIPSDSPYATLDANYFVPEWPVGRLPGDAGSDAGILLDQLRLMQRYHTRKTGIRTVFGVSWMQWFKTLFDRLRPAPASPTFGYTAAIWKRSSLAVFRHIGPPQTVLACPPDNSTTIQPDRAMSARLSYYNLHGLEDSPAWYGQRDPSERGDESDYPVAITPDNIHRNGRAPRVIFSEACYGGHIFGKTEDESLTLKFLSAGTMAVVSSTCVSYGSVNTPLIAADLLGSLFWRNLRSGRTAGESLMQAKIDLVREMNRRQGYLDGEDQKTLISFVLYGDPLAAYDGLRVRPKLFYRFNEHPMVRTVSDNTEEGPVPGMSAEALRQVKRVVAEYLPGADLSKMHVSRHHLPQATDDLVGAVASLSSSAQPAMPHRNQRKIARPDGLSRPSERLVVTVSKQVRTAQHIHKHYVRMTLDETGKTVKLSVSR